MKRLYALGSYLLSSTNEKPFILLREAHPDDDLKQNKFNRWMRSEKAKHFIRTNPQALPNFTGIFITIEDAKEFMEKIRIEIWCPKDIHIIGLVFQDKEKEENE